MRNELDEAVFAAFKAVEVAVRAAGGYKATDIGVTLMRKSFDAQSGPLCEAEREALFICLRVRSAPTEVHTRIARLL
jgi:Protein of unknown function (Hypoth_ymh)